MNEPLPPIGFYVRHSSGRLTGTLRAAASPTWELRRQAIQVSAEGETCLVDQLLATGLTLRNAWAAMIAIARPRSEKSQ
jgi:hypothetical protein